MDLCMRLGNEADREAGIRYVVPETSLTLAVLRLVKRLRPASIRRLCAELWPDLPFYPAHPPSGASGAGMKIRAKLALPVPE